MLAVLADLLAVLAWLLLDSRERSPSGPCRSARSLSCSTCLPTARLLVC
jgi:hypothetical protein